MLKGLVVKKDTEIRDLKHKVTAFEKVDNNRKVSIIFIFYVIYCILIFNL